MKVLCLDESGDHNLVRIERDYPLFVLGDVIVEREYARTVLGQRVRDFKQNLFGRDDLILHTADIARNQNGFDSLKHTTFRHRFYDQLNHLMRGLDYQVVACVIKKDEHLARYGAVALDPYMLSLNVLVERFCFVIGDQADAGLIVAEKRRPDLDIDLEVSWLALCRGERDFRWGT